jgi:hypothetical protein
MMNHKNVARLGVGALIAIVTMGIAGAWDHTVKVESNDGHRARHDERIDRGLTVRLVRQLSDRPCVEGRSWGWDSRGIWVDRGCRAEFLVSSARIRPIDTRPIRGGRGRGNGGGIARGNAYSTRIELSSSNGRRGVYRATHIEDARLVKQLSSAPCRQGSTWGWDTNSVWVSGGCRGLFDVYRR